MRGGTRRRRVKIMEKKYWSRVCYRRIFFAIILRGWGAIGTGGQIFFPFPKKTEILNTSRKLDAQQRFPTPATGQTCRIRGSTHPNPSEQASTIQFSTSPTPPPTPNPPPPSPPPRPSPPKPPSPFPTKKSPALHPQKFTQNPLTFPYQKLPKPKNISKTILPTSTTTHLFPNSKT
jgi:hypothetical protein